ncbi:hypothetical protein CVT24_012528 [Panaeolus cyanescens]|uniref:Peptidase S1 domain-containing protein n=1 Tax=Panaeolus cyanescens TaxID=181874 RepID=A0A409YK13_9AGAR|nr:hypothetical protein CVT24_012528 [Panaeolus cyanescens]
MESSNRAQYPPINITNTNHIDLPSLHSSAVVKLISDHNCNGQNVIGTGFFIHIPESPYEVILTAAHNLWTATNGYARNTTILLPHPNIRSPDHLSIPISPACIKVCAQYMREPTNPNFDYGAILVPYSSNSKRRGFGFKMTHAFCELRGTVNVSSYRQGSSPGRPVWTTGHVVNEELTDNRLVYEATAENAGNGAPLWIAEGTEDVFVLAIQGTGSDFFVFPAEVTDSTSTRYALALGKRWVKFDNHNQKVGLQDQLDEQCLFTRKPMDSGVFSIVLKDDFLFKMDGPEVQKSGIFKLLLASELPAGYTPN